MREGMRLLGVTLSALESLNTLGSNPALGDEQETAPRQLALAL